MFHTKCLNIIVSKQYFHEYIIKHFWSNTIVIKRGKDSEVNCIVIKKNYGLYKIGIQTVMEAIQIMINTTTHDIAH
ncbi:hypothetical protein A9Q75_19150 [Colwellia psychrerythraea]|uniref:Uncharacterized protein n=1 Tax=Colwellia psychrerythraea TaxID=28229 RepID=A0A1Y5DWF2_COLPS|nr:hypothetical protein A9Q75_19150 [Colwellia psychrerythraea]